MDQKLFDLGVRSYGVAEFTVKITAWQGDECLCLCRLCGNFLSFVGLFDFYEFALILCIS